MIASIIIHGKLLSAFELDVPQSIRTGNFLRLKDGVYEVKEITYSLDPKYPPCTIKLDWHKC